LTWTSKLIDVILTDCSVSSNTSWQLLNSTLTFLTQMACLSNQNQEYCLASLGALNDLNIPIDPISLQAFSRAATRAPFLPLHMFTFTLHNFVDTNGNTNDDDDTDDDGFFAVVTYDDCNTVIARMGCCLGSALDTRVSIAYEFIGVRTAVLLSTIPAQCAALGVEVNTTACASAGGVDECTALAFAGVPSACQAYVAAVPALLVHGEVSHNATEALCNSTCKPFFPPAARALAAHTRMYVSRLSNALACYSR
jgi:hypothetical protein